MKVFVRKKKNYIDLGNRLNIHKYMIDEFYILIIQSK